MVNSTDKVVGLFKLTVFVAIFAVQNNKSRPVLNNKTTY